MSDNNSFDKDFKDAQHNVLAAFSKVQFAVMNAENAQWDIVRVRALEEASAAFSKAVRQARAANNAIAIAMSEVHDKSGPSPADLIKKDESVWSPASENRDIII